MSLSISFAISSVGILREVRDGNHAEFADFLQRVHLGIAEKIGAVADVIGARRITAFVAGGVLVASLGAIAAARGFRHLIPGAFACWMELGLCCADGAARGGVAQVAGVLRIVGKGVARH